VTMAIVVRIVRQAGTLTATMISAPFRRIGCHGVRNDFIGRGRRRIHVGGRVEPVKRELHASIAEVISFRANDHDSGIAKF